MKKKDNNFILIGIIVFLGYLYLQEKNKNNINKSLIYGNGGASRKIARLLSSVKPKIQKTLNYWKKKKKY